MVTCVRIFHSLMEPQKFILIVISFHLISVPKENKFIIKLFYIFVNVFIYVFVFYYVVAGYGTICCINVSSPFLEAKIYIQLCYANILAIQY